jgi:mono/diheme cytochrome c family protein
MKMSAMPAWGKFLDDAAIWDIVSFVRKMPR